MSPARSSVDYDSGTRDDSVARAGSGGPRLSVVVPVYNGAEDLRRCLAALAASHYDNFEVLVVDDGSTEPVEPVVTASGFTYLRLAGPGGPARACNHGAAHATGPYLVFIDADVCVHQDTLARFAERFTADPLLDAVVGSCDDAPAASNFLSQYKNLFHHYVHQTGDGEICTFWSGCGAIRRELYLLKTDIFARGMPWMGLMLRAGGLADTLNVKRTQRLSVVLAYLLALSLVAAAWWRGAWISVVLLALMVTVINYDFYRFFTARQGEAYTLRVVPLHWLYFGYCGFCVVWGMLLYALSDREIWSVTHKRTPKAHEHGREMRDAHGGADAT